MQPTDVQFFFKIYVQYSFKLTTYYYALNTLLHFFCIPQHIFKHEIRTLVCLSTTYNDVTSTTTTKETSSINHNNALSYITKGSISNC